MGILQFLIFDSKVENQVLKFAGEKFWELIFAIDELIFAIDELFFAIYLLKYNFEKL